MKSIIMLIAGLMYSFIIIKGQNNVVRALDHFSKIEVKNGIFVQLVKSDKESADINTQEIQPNQVITEIKDGILSFRLDKQPFTKSKVMVKLYYKNISMIKASGKSEISSNSLIKQDSLSIDLASGAKAYLSLDIKYLKSELTEGALISADGYAVKQEASVATGATLSAFDLESDEITIKVSANGKAKINVDKSLTADVSTGGYVSYKGAPTVKDINTSIGGKVEQYTE